LLQQYARIVLERKRRPRNRSKMHERPRYPLVSRRWLVAGICSVSPALASGCRSKKEPLIIDPTDLDRINAGEVVSLRALLRQPAEQVCLLTPYRDRLEEVEPLSHQVNPHLKAMNLTLQDGGFALVFVNGDKVSVQRLSEVRHDIVAWHEGAGRILKSLGCASVDRVLVTKVIDPLWPRLVFGEER
jgi:hypothetical protein